MKTIKIAREGDKVLAILSVIDWFAPELIRFPIVKTDFVVVKWVDYTHGVDNNQIEAKETIAICREEEDARAIYLYNHKQWERKTPVMEENY